MGITSLDWVPREIPPVFVLHFTFALVIGWPRVIGLLNLPTKIVGIDQIRPTGLRDMGNRSPPILN